ncbi:MAG: hypothetical protein U5K74_14040 [Gemmatimonadaceae bacterium]|nr:hypothetical protein [Gemmatimonadaceae bacterium]
MTIIALRRHLIRLALVPAVTACASSSSRRCGEAVDPGELRRLSMTTDSTLVALRQAPDSQAKALQQYLQSVVDRTAALEACGRIRSASDLQTAAQLALAAGRLGEETVERAYVWSRRAVVADTADRASWRVMAHAWDQLQLLRQQPQWFATVIRCEVADGRCVLAPLDTTRVSDPQRAELGLRTLVQQRELLDSLNRSLPKR